MTNPNTDVPPGARWASSSSNTPIQPPGLGEARKAREIQQATPVSQIKPVERGGAKKMVKALFALVVALVVLGGAVFGIKAVTKKDTDAVVSAESAESDEPVDAAAPPDDEPDGAIEESIDAAETVVADINASHPDYAAQVELRDAYVVAKVYLTDNETYATMTPDAMTEIEPSMSFAPMDAVDADSVGVLTMNAGGLALARQSLNGTWFCLMDDGSTVTTFGQGPDLETALASCHEEEW